MDGTTTTATQSFAQFAGWSVTTAQGDLNADGKDDLFWQHTDGSAAAWLMDGTNRVACVDLGHAAGWMVS
jgi:hypothetical protein